MYVQALPRIPPELLYGLDFAILGSHLESFWGAFAFWHLQSLQEGLFTLGGRLEPSRSLPESLLGPPGAQFGANLEPT